MLLDIIRSKPLYCRPPPKKMCRFPCLLTLYFLVFGHVDFQILTNWPLISSVVLGFINPTWVPVHMKHFQLLLFRIIVLSFQSHRSRIPPQQYVLVQGGPKATISPELVHIMQYSWRPSEPWVSPQLVQSAAQ